MLTGVSALRCVPRCHYLHKTCLQYTRSASRLSAVKRGLQGESQDEPRRFPGKTSSAYGRASSRRNEDLAQGKDPFGRALSGKNDDSATRKPYGGARPRRNDDFVQDNSSYGRPPPRRNGDSADRKPYGRAPTRRSDDFAWERSSASHGRAPPRGNHDSADRKPYGKSPTRRSDDFVQDNSSYGRPPLRGNHDSADRKPYSRGPSRRSDDMTHEKDPPGRDMPRRNDEPDRERKPYSRSPARDSGRNFDSKSAKPDNSSRTDYVSIPYTTAASEFLYGSNVVYAALKSRRRTLHTLYLHKRARENAYKGATLEKLATSAGVRIRRVDNDFLPVMDKMTDDRPHNGVILEASPLPVPPVEQLGRVPPASRQTPILLSQSQTAEQRALYGISQFLPAPTDAWRQPFVLLVDGILDPGNLGNILRTAYFYGVDAVAVCINTCAPLTSPALHKAASGATEALSILAIHRPADFVSISSRNGWRTHAAVAPEATNSQNTTRPQFSTNKMVSPLTRAPSILMMGAEGEGLRLNLKTKAHYNVLIAGQQRLTDANDIGVDSLNVGAATAVLIEAFMRPPVETRDRRAAANAADAEKAREKGEEDGAVEEEEEEGSMAKYDAENSENGNKLF